MKIAIQPRGADLNAVTDATRSAAELAAIGGYVAQVWTWRGGEAVVVREWTPSGDCERWVVLVKRGLRAGSVVRVPAGSIAAALGALGIAYRIKSARRPPAQLDPRSSAARRYPLLRAVHRRGNTWRTLRAPRSIRAAG